MNFPLSNRVCFEKSAGERRWDEDQARWEARLRKLAAQGRAKAEPVPIVRLAPARTILEAAAAVGPRDALLIPRRLPALTGTEAENLVCVKCFEILGSGISARTARRRHPEGQSLVIRCPCGALNLVARDPGRRA